MNFTVTSSSDTKCQGYSAIIKKTYFEDSRIEVSESFCGQVRLPAIRINGTVEIELSYDLRLANITEVSIAVMAEASTKSKS